jgi:hypothetical protein
VICLDVLRSEVTIISFEDAAFKAFIFCYRVTNEWMNSYSEHFKDGQRGCVTIPHAVVWDRHCLSLVGEGEQMGVSDAAMNGWLHY